VSRRAAPQPWRGLARRAAGAASLDTARLRLTMGMIAFVAVMGVIALRLADLSVTGPHDPRRHVAAVAPRAEVVDRRGVTLAGNYRAYALVVRPRQLVKSPDYLAPRIAALTGQDSAQVLAQLTHPSSFRYIARRVRPAVAQAVANLGEPGIELHREPDRLYPNLMLAAHTVGFASIDGEGQAGVERALDTALKAPAGGEVALSIDARVQSALEVALADGMDRFQAIGASGIIMDVRTGEVLAIASLPSFNPNSVADFDPAARFNRATQGVYELGSTFKAFTIAMALETGASTPDELHDARTPIRIGRFTINDSKPRRAPVTLGEVLAYSSNVATGRLADRMGPKVQRDHFRALGLLDPLPIELPERGRPLYPAQNSRVTMLTMSYGHGIAVTPLHLAAGYAALVNGGIWHPPTLMRQPQGREPPGRRVFSEETSRTINAMLRLTVQKGTGKKAEAVGYRVGGKTGTAEKPEAGGYNRKSLITTFAAAFPMDAPRYVVVVTLDEPKPTRETFGQASAAWNAAPLVRQVVERSAPLLGVAPEPERDLDTAWLLPRPPASASATATAAASGPAPATPRASATPDRAG
jgi:cell division protein FtsI (penicillin-binding protein 3)